MVDGTEKALDYDPDHNFTNVVGEEIEDDLTSDIDFDALNSSTEKGE